MKNKDNQHADEDLIKILREICGPDWYKQHHDENSHRIKADLSGQIFICLFNLQEIQEIQDSFALVTGVASIITTTEGVPITSPSNFCHLCQNVIRKTDLGLKNCFRSDAEIGRYNAGEPIIQQCLSGGLWDAGASITAGQIHIANWLIGQVRNENTDTEAMKAYARRIGADIDEFLAALQMVTVMSADQFRQVSKALFLMANQMSQRAYQNLQQTHLILERRRAEKIISKSPAVAFHLRNEPGWPVEYVSENVYALFGHTAEDFMGGRITYSELIYSEDAARVAEEVAKNSLDTRVKEFSHEPYRIISSAGEKKWLEDITRIIRTEDGHVSGYEGIVMDITERKEMSEERRKLESQLQRAQKMELIGTLAGGVAHELNNILGVIVGYPDLLLKKLPEESPLRQNILKIQQAGIRAADIVQDMLILARRGVVTKEVVSLNRILSDHLNSPAHQQGMGQHPRIQTDERYECDLLNILGSPAHLSNMMMNLIQNAIDALPDGGKITISTHNQYLDKGTGSYEGVGEGDYVVMRISDNGAGMSSEDTDRIFEPFYTKKRMGRSGTGLGMAVVWGTVRDHEGYITVDSSSHEGTTFTLYFPVTRSETADECVSAPTETYMGSGEKILVVDDMAEQREIAAMLLKKLGYTVSEASSGEEAIEFLRHNPADLLVLDMIMDPGIDGLETLRRALKLYPGQRAVIASGFSETGRVREAWRLGAGSYISKPFTLEKIGLAVKGELGTS